MPNQGNRMSTKTHPEEEKKGSKLPPAVKSAMEFLKELRQTRTPHSDKASDSAQSGKTHLARNLPLTVKAFLNELHQMPLFQQTGTYPSGPLKDRIMCCEYDAVLPDARKRADRERSVFNKESLVLGRDRTKNSFDELSDTLRIGGGKPA